MSNLILELRQGDMMVVNGAAIRFRNRTRIELTAHARFLYGRQIMSPQEADTPARRIYFALQTAYIGDEQERKHGLGDAETFIEAFKAATTSPSAIALLAGALAHAKADRCYHALRLARRVVRHEDAILGRGPVENTTRLPHAKSESTPDPLSLSLPSDDGSSIVNTESPVVSASSE